MIDGMNGTNDDRPDDQVAVLGLEEARTPGTRQEGPTVTGQEEPPIPISPTELGRRIRELRQERNKTQYDVAVAARLAPATIHKIEAGKTRSPRFDVIDAIAGALEVPVTDLLGLQPIEASSSGPAERVGSPQSGAETVTDVIRRITSGRNAERTAREIERFLRLSDSQMGMANDIMERILAAPLETSEDPGGPTPPTTPNDPAPGRHGPTTKPQTGNSGRLHDREVLAGL